jgi:hypothetical protein
MDRNAGLPEGFSASTELGNAHGEIQHFRFWNFFFFLIFLPCLVKTVCNNSMNRVGINVHEATKNIFHGKIIP